MPLTSNVTIFVVTAIVLVMLTCFSRWVPAIKLAGIKIIPAWAMLVVSLVVATIFGWLQWFALLSLAALFFFIYCFQYSDRRIIRWVAGSSAVLLLLALGFHTIPGFENQLLVDGKSVKPGSTPYTLYFNLDKTFGGLIFFLVLANKEAITRMRWGLVSLVAASNAILVLGIGWLVGIVNLELTQYFNYEFVAIFIALQLFSVCLTEEIFFRGFIQENLYSLFSSDSKAQRWVPLLITSILFGLVHIGGGLTYAILASLAGIGYGLIYQLTRRVEFSIIAHTFLNLVHLTFFTYPFSLNY